MSSGVLKARLGRGSSSDWIMSSPRPISVPIAMARAIAPATSRVKRTFVSGGNTKGFRRWRDGSCMGSALTAENQPPDHRIRHLFGFLLLHASADALVKGKGAYLLKLRLGELRGGA